MGVDFNVFSTDWNQYILDVKTILTGEQGGRVVSIYQLL
jgi:hypothetical protein